MGMILAALPVEPVIIALGHRPCDSPEALPHCFAGRHTAIAAGNSGVACKSNT
jgi:hypothetical protein